MEEKKKRLNIQMDAESHRKLKMYAALMGKTMSEVVTDLIDEAYEKNATQEKISGK